MRKFGCEFLDELASVFVDQGSTEEGSHQLVMRVAELWGGQQVYIPFAKQLLIQIRNQEILASHKAGTCVHKIAKTHKLSEMHIYRIIQEATQNDPRQQELF